MRKTLSPITYIYHLVVTDAGQHTRVLVYLKFVLVCLACGSLGEVILDGFARCVTKHNKVFTGLMDKECFIGAKCPQGRAIS